MGKIKYWGLFFVGLFFVTSVFAKTTYLRLGEEAYAKFEYNKALTYFKKSIEAGSSKGEPWFYIGMIYEFQRKYTESIPYFEHSLLLPMEKKEYRQAALWKLVILHDKTQNYLRVIELVDQMEQEGIVHPNLTKLKEKALLLASESKEKLQARQLLALAKQKETMLQPKQKEKNFWINHAQEIHELIDLYQQAFELSDKLDVSFLWKTARYQEKLKLYPEAVITYKKILQQDETITANYKLGVLLKTMGKFYQAADYLTRALNTEKISERFLYYVHLNLAEVFYGLKRFSKTADEAKAAQEYFAQRISQDKNSQLAKILFCASSVHSAVSLSDLPAVTNDDQKSSGKTKALQKTPATQEKKETKEDSFQTACEKLYAKEATSIDREEQGLFLLQKFLYVSFFPSDMLLKQENKTKKAVNFLQESLQTCSGKEEECYPLWMRHDFVLIAEFLFEQKEFALLYRFLSLGTEADTKELRGDSRYKNWLAETSFALNKFAEAIQAYEHIFERSELQEQHYWISLAKTENYQRLFDKLNNFLYIHEDEQKNVFSFLKKEKTFRDFLSSEQYKKLKENFLQ